MWNFPAVGGKDVEVSDQKDVILIDGREKHKQAGRASDPRLLGLILVDRKLV
jgi:hypothetical protein